MALAWTYIVLSGLIWVVAPVAVFLGLTILIRVARWFGRSVSGRR